MENKNLIKRYLEIKSQVEALKKEMSDIEELVRDLNSKGEIPEGFKVGEPYYMIKVSDITSAYNYVKKDVDIYTFLKECSITGAKFQDLLVSIVMNTDGFKKVDEVKDKVKKIILDLPFTEKTLCKGKLTTTKK